MSTTTSHGHGHGETGADPQSVAAGHELKDANVSPLALSAFGLLALLAFSFIFIVVLMSVSGISLNQTGNTLPDAAVSQLQLPPAPRLEQNPTLDGNQIVVDATTRLSGYGWVDQQAGTAHIPISRAMELLLERGLDGK
ncbi:MAG: hypothetical protein HGB28_04300 [Oscillochloris sp.]|nr:hypothetical protein [Oscillochloris sp.]